MIWWIFLDVSFGVWWKCDMFDFGGWRLLFVVVFVVVGM